VPIRTCGGNGARWMTDNLDLALTEEIKSSSMRVGDEWVIPFPHVVAAIEAASRSAIAVLGVEVFELLPDGIRLDVMSGYDFRDSTDWDVFVARCNDAAKQFVTNNTRPDGYGYILTATSEREHEELGKLRLSWQM
jgi:hypothetical protein